MTHAEIIYRRRVALLALCQRNRQRGGGLPELRRVAGPAITNGRTGAERYGLEALMPKARRIPRCPLPRPPTWSERLLTLAVLEPTIGCRQYADRLGDQGFVDRQVDRAKAPGHPRPGETLRAPGPGRGPSLRPRRDWSPRPPPTTSPSGSAWPVAARASWSASTASTSGNTKASARGTQLQRHRRLHPLGLRLVWCSALPTPPCRCASWTACSATIAAMGSKFRAVLSDNGPEYNASAFSAHAGGQRAEPCARPTRSPNHNAVVKRFHQTILQECWRPAFHRRCFTSVRQLQAEADTYLLHLQPAAAQPRRLHGRPDPTRDPRQPQEEQGSMTTINRRGHLLRLQLQVRKLSSYPATLLVEEVTLWSRC